MATTSHQVFPSYDPNQSPWKIEKPEGLPAVLNEVKYLLEDMKERRYFNDLPSHRVTQIINGMADVIASQQEQIDQLRLEVERLTATPKSSPK